ncbi:multicopper oxidase domain-containing protein [Streptomyces mirabilis]|uniref:multicopper oxidase domain-containing protein n=1 Tax=Streptomyces mirabilis TaxID=68239 RepID=UPI003693850E
MTAYGSRTGAWSADSCATIRKSELIGHAWWCNSDGCRAAEPSPPTLSVGRRGHRGEEWTVRNDSDEEHSFHVHVNDFQLMSVNGRPHHGHGLQDTASVPAKGQLVIRIHFTNYTGKTVLHWHILNHEDAGMMAVLEIVK